MQILQYYKKTQKTVIIECYRVDVGSGGLAWVSKTGHGFIGFSLDWDLTIVSN